MATLTLSFSAVRTYHRISYTIVNPLTGYIPIVMDLSIGSSGTNSHYNDIQEEGIVNTLFSCLFNGNFVLSIKPVKTHFSIDLIEPVLITSASIPVATSFRLFLYRSPGATNRFWTSDIGGEVSFDKTDERPHVTDNAIPFKGWLYRALKLGDHFVIYGQNGIVRAIPSETEWGQVIVHSVGLRGKLAVCGDENTHYFIDAQGYMGVLTEKGLQLADYRQWLSNLNSQTVLTFDPRNRRVHISDGVIGFTFTEFGLGDGLPNVTGMGLQDGNFYFATDYRGQTSPPFHIMTDVLDFGTRGQKTVAMVEISTDVISDMKVSIHYKTKGDSASRISPWYRVLPGGVAYPLVTGVEFQVEVLQNAYAKTTVDRIGIRGKYWS